MDKEKAAQKPQPKQYQVQQPQPQLSVPFGKMMQYYGEACFKARALEDKLSSANAEIGILRQELNQTTPDADLKNVID